MNRKSGQQISEQDALFQTAAALHQSGHIAKAIECYRQLLGQSPNNPQILYLLGTAECQNGSYLAGEKLLMRSLEIAPDNVSAHMNRGTALQELKRFEDALQSFDRVIRLKPDFAEAYSNKGKVLQKLERREEALQSYDRVIRLKPDSAEAHIDRGNLLQDLKRFDEALPSYDRTIQLKADFAEAYNNKGNVLRELDRLEEALNCFDRAIQLKPDFAEAYYNRGNTLRDLKRMDDASRSYDLAIELKPGLAYAYWNKAILKILTGDYEEGWKLFEWGWETKQRGTRRDFKQPLWLGTESIANKTILIHAEQGLGDVIQFCRYLPMIEKLGAKIIFEIPASLMTLISTLKCNCEIAERGKSLPDFDVHCPIMSLPHAFKTTLQTIPSEIPYLYPDKAKQAVWKQKLGIKRHLRVGLAWSGSPAHLNDRNRSIELRSFKALFDMPVEFHSLQKEYKEEDKRFLNELAQVQNHQKDFADFSDTAALIAEMDLVISVDTSVAHLAGALDKPVWIVLPFNPDYRWMLDRADSPWYPTATLIRQTASGEWDGIISDIRNRIATQFQV